MAVKRVLMLIGVLLAAGGASAQPFPNGSVPAHVICDSGCAGGGTVTVQQSDATKLQATVTNANLDIALSALRDALRGASAKTLTDVVNALGALSVSITGTVPISATSLPLPSGAATDSSLSTLDTDLKSNITLHAGTNVIGHVVNDSGSTTAVTGNVTAVQSTGTNLHTVVDSGTITAVTGITNALPAGSNVIGHVIVDSSGVVHVVIDSSASLAVTGPLTDTQLRASAVPVSLASAPTTAVTNASLDGTTLASIKTDLDKIPTSPAQEGGHLATIDTSTAASKTDLDTIATNTANVAAAVDQPATTAASYVMSIGAVDLNGTTRAGLADPSGASLVISRPAVAPALLLPCNALRRQNCR
jgi:hypothetical protein